MLRLVVFGIACCSAGEAAADWQTETVAEMRTHLYLPSSEGRAGAGRALLIALHGCTQSPDALRDRGRFETPAEDHGAVIALPAVPNGGVLAGCWDYYGGAHTIESRHDRYLIALADELAADGALGIDPDQIYLIGLSSGGGEAAVIGCLAPDRFAGIGINAGPAVGTEAFEIATVATDVATAAPLCAELAGPRAAGFDTQLTSVIAGSGDFIVARAYARLDAEIMAEVYRNGGAALIESDLDVASLPGTTPSGTGAIWSDADGPRVSLIMVEGMGHAFPAGSGDGLETNFVAQKGVAWPEYVLGFFEANNRRIGGVHPAADAGAIEGADASVRDGSGKGDGSTYADANGDPTDPSAGAGCGCGATDGRPGSGWLALSFAAALLLLARRRG